MRRRMTERRKRTIAKRRRMTERRTQNCYSNLKKRKRK